MRGLSWVFACLWFFSAGPSVAAAAKPCSLQDIVGDWIYTEARDEVFCAVKIDATGKFQSSINSPACQWAKSNIDGSPLTWRLTGGKIDVTSQCRATGHVSLSKCTVSTGQCYEPSFRRFFAFISNDLSRMTGRATRFTVLGGGGIELTYFNMEFILLP